MCTDQQTGFMRADLTGLAYTYAQPSYKKEEKLNPSGLLLWTELTEMLQGLGRGTPLVVARWLPPGSAHFRHLEGFLPAGGEIADPFLVRYSPQD